MGRVPQTDSPETVSDLATLAVKTQIPADCFAILGWPSQQSTVELVAELVEPGRIRFHLAAKLLPLIQAKRAQIQASASQNRLDLLGAFDDRYGTTSLYNGKRGEHTVVVEHRFAAYLGVLPSDDKQILVESTRETVDFMSLTRRYRRQELLRDAISVDNSD
jgi:hypothetical protein